MYKEIYEKMAEITGHEVSYLQFADEVEIIRPSEAYELAEYFAKQHKKHG